MNRTYEIIDLPTMLQGSYIEYDFVLRREKENEPDSYEPVPLTDNIVRFIVKRDKNDPDENALINKVISEHTDAAQGLTKIIIESDDTKELDGIYYYWIIIEKINSNNFIKPVAGTFSVVK